ncbi:nicotinamide-nucleotide amidohydrolase family protein [Horticoccus luteus]|uniref:Nicotinamide-nucleotide amidohydrolase family protein n=1 Tax=Horticoccus luteus TaxID=2862869 RepID=A0A8F9TVC3_9BACT|nr:nicotinamide-nucleotide amidohydrolase family protein [Horticoccus luteus]QYM78666.1 nicotinamide-nucleotide amidohydrolase family protein [Horticoccus luteus]
MKRELKELMLESPGRTLAVAESLTCGQVQARIGAIAGASQFFLGGVTAYTLEQKVKLLGVDRAAAKRVNCVSAAVAEQMARGAGELFGSELAVATTGYAQAAAEWAVEEPFAWWALAHRRRGGKFFVRSGRIECPGEKRTDVQAIVAAAVLAELVSYLGELAAAR